MYNFDKVVNRKGTNCIKWDMFEKSGVSEDVIPMFIADMDFEVLPEIKEALEKRVAQAVYGYTMPPADYKSVVANWMLRRHDWDVKEDWIVTCPGVVPALSIAVAAYTNPGDAVLVQGPFYGPFKGAPEKLGRRAIIDPLVNTNGYYTMDFEAIEKIIVDEKIKMWIICNPQNPVGRVWSKDELLKVADLCEKYHVILVSDEIHHDFVFKGYKQIPAATVSEAAMNQTVVCTSPGKTFNVAGLQSANIIIPNEDLRKKFEDAMRGSGFNGVTMFGIDGTYAAYKYGDQWVDELVEYVEGNYHLVCDFISENHLPINVIKQEGLYLIWLDFRPTKMQGDDIKNWLINEAKCWPNGGLFFGEYGNGYDRINLATRRELVLKFLDNLKAACDRL